MVNSSKEIEGFRLKTPQEHLLIGSTPRLSLAFQEEPNPVVPNEFYIPEGIQFDGLTFEEINEERRRRGYFVSSLSWNLGLIDYQLALSLPELDPQTFMTVRDPAVIGVIHQDRKGVIEQMAGRDLMRESVEMMKYYATLDPYSNIRWRFRRESVTLVNLSTG